MGVATNSTRRLAEAEVKASIKGAEKFVKKNCLYPYYFIHRKVVTHSGKVVYTTIIIYTH